MHECEQKHGNSSKTGPAVLYKQGVQGCKTAGISQCPLCRVSHDHDGYHDLIGRQSKDESQQNDTVQSHKPSHRFQESGKMQQQGSIPHSYICQYPDNESCRGRRDQCPPEYVKGAVHNRAHQHTEELGPPVRRKFQRKRGGNPLQYCLRQKPG